MTEWVEHQPPVKHDGGPCPCPDFLIVKTWTTRKCRPAQARFVPWVDVKYWRPADPDWECSFDRDRLVAYRKKEPTE